MNNTKAGYPKRQPRAAFLLGGLILLLLLLAAPPLRPAGGESAVEKRRVERLVAHLKRLHRPEDWRVVRKLFSNDRSLQLNALSSCPLPENEWPWHLSSRHLEEYAFTVDFIPVNMDGDAEEETLIVIQSDPGEVHYITFCLVDDEKRGRNPLASYSDLSRGRPVTYQIANLTGDGGSELVIFTREGPPDRHSDAVRVIKPSKDRRFELVWFARLQEQFRWPSRSNGGGDGRTVDRFEQLRAKVRLHFDGPRRPATLILKGEREYEETVSYFNGVHHVNQKSVQKFPFEEHWRWDKKQFQFVRVPIPK